MKDIIRVSVLLAVCCVLQHNVNSMWTDIDITKVEPYNNSKSLPITIVLHPKRIKRGLFGLSGMIYIYDYFDDYMLEILVWHSAARNNQYKLLPIKVPQGPMCAKFNSEYRTYVMKALHEASDLPYSDDKNTDLCPMFAKGKTFEVKNFQFNPSSIPKFLPPVLYKLEFLLKRQNDNTIVVGGLYLTADLT